jgi:hypothetical protein
VRKPLSFEVGIHFGYPTPTQSVHLGANATDAQEFHSSCVFLWAYPLLHIPMDREHGAGGNESFPRGRLSSQSWVMRRRPFEVRPFDDVPPQMVEAAKCMLAYRAA